MRLKTKFFATASAYYLIFFCKPMRTATAEISVRAVIIGAWQINNHRPPPPPTNRVFGSQRKSVCLASVYTVIHLFGLQTTITKNTEKTSFNEERKKKTGVYLISATMMYDRYFVSSPHSIRSYAIDSPYISRKPVKHSNPRVLY